MKRSDSRFGRLGIEVGTVGRWARLGIGALMLAPIAVKVAGDLVGDGDPLSFYLRAALYTAAIAATFVMVYRLLSPRVLERVGPWTNTAIFVGPAFTAAWWPVLLGPWIGIALPADLTLAVGAYIGLSFLLQWRIGYGGCEGVSLPIALGAPRHATYCVPLVVADVVEKRIVDRRQVAALEASQV